MFPRPFRTEVLGELLPFEGNLQICIRLQPHGGAVAPSAEALGELFRALARVGQWGGMAGSDIAPIDSSMTLLADAHPLGHNEFLWAYSAQNVDAGTGLVIENLVHHVHLRGQRVEVLQIRSPILSKRHSVRVTLPTYFEPLPFEMEYDVENTQVLVDIDSEGSWNAQALEPFREVWDAWTLIAMSGAFADETYPPAQASLAVEDDLTITSTGMGAAFDDVNIADAGFYCLVNSLQVFHEKLAPIQRATIE
jgi:hypothetical protein